ncbi:MULTISPECIES: YuzF family protein [Bacillus subtilis group]|nr:MULTISPECIES: YuzF family protein [Bacillus subtilis group]APA02427.1 hypothetical protein BK055_07715 [Bacillus velezensis]ASZ63347.1 DUF2642 domain-containing protein [Bacillus subtilis]MBO3767523.1 YuzF family protein [Bacillus subtilis]PLV31444.1 hypothetical protein BSP2_43830 [Bacillus subtilis subsp. subtilis]QAW07798.1 DUF2642 domain-containing protein [Bacillus subtilis]
MSEKWKLSDPYVYQALMGLHNQSLAVQTTHGSVRGVLREVMPDHIVIMMGGTPFYVRTAQVLQRRNLAMLN